MVIKEPSVRELFRVIEIRRQFWDKSATTNEDSSSDDEEMEEGEEEEKEDDPKIDVPDTPKDSNEIVATTAMSAPASIGMQQKRDKLELLKAEIARLRPILLLACTN